MVHCVTKEIVFILQQMVSPASLSCLSSLLKFMIENSEDIFEVGVRDKEKFFFDIMQNYVFLGAS